MEKKYDIKKINECFRVHLHSFCVLSCILLQRYCVPTRDRRLAFPHKTFVVEIIHWK